MFPPETSSNVLPWHVLVPVMQICGCFPYRMSATGGTPTFSLSLLLWAVAVELFMFPVYFMANRIISEQHLTSEFGTFALVYSWGVSCTVVCLTPILLGVKSATLAALLHELSGMQGIFPPVARRWYCRPKALALLSLCMFWIGFQMYVAITWRMEQFFEIFSSVFAAFMYTMNSVVPTQLCSMLFGLLARHVEAATEATVVTVSSLLIPDGSFKCDKDVEVAMLALRDLDAVIREVEVQRQTGARCVFPVVSLYLEAAIMVAVVCPYAIMTGIFINSATTFSLLLSYSVMVTFFNVGQAFVNKIVIAEGLLKELRVKSRNDRLTMKVSQVMGSLSPLLIFDMCGWYRLDYATFLGLMNTVLTYVVIIFQVGGNNFEKFLFASSGPRNASAFQKQETDA